jgi:uncharacterized delta-60 repeat protein
MNISLHLTFTLWLILAVCNTPAFAAPGDLDPAFGISGRVLRSFSAAGDQIDDIARQADGKIVVAGRIGFVPGAASAFGVARFNLDGTTDSTFGMGGFATTSFSSPLAWANSLAIQPDGKIVVCGSGFFQNGASHMVIARYLPDGSLDPAFRGGKVETALGLYTGSQAIAVQPDGKIVVAGFTGRYIIVVRYLADGSYDKQFGRLGRLTTVIGPGGQGAQDLKVQPDGKIIVAGSYSTGATEQFALVRYTPNGRLDKTFGHDGVQLTSFGGSFCNAFSLDIGAEGKVLAAGYASTIATGAFALARYNTDGSPDTTFDLDGMIVTETGGQDGAAFDIAVQADGKIVAAGFIRNPGSAGYTDFLLFRYRGDGSLDTGFGTGGRVQTAMSAEYDEIKSVFIQPDGRIVAGGYASGPNGAPNFALARYTGN